MNKLNLRGQIWGLAKIFYLVGNGVVFKQYTVLNEEPVKFVQEICHMAEHTMQP